MVTYLIKLKLFRNFLLKLVYFLKYTLRQLDQHISYTMVLRWRIISDGF